MKSWSVSDSLKLYNIENWGNKYFYINPAGRITVHPKQGLDIGVDMIRVIEDIRERGLNFPILIRFQDIIRHRVVTLNETFRNVIAEAGYKGRYQGVYPIKVNQMREVVEEILDAGVPYDFGLEAGSKAELAAAISMDIPQKAILICNGYKDYAFIKMALMGLKCGRRVVIVIEKTSEIPAIIEVSKELDIKPLLGMRVKLSARGSGKWIMSSGDSAKFGLTIPELLESVKILRENGMEDSFKLLHFHIGSQITDIKNIQDAVKEGTRVYGKLQKMGMNIEFIDVGGGLGVDYDGSRTNFESSINYSMSEYAASVIYTVKEICEAEKVPEPDIVSESGRALVAHHSVLVVNVFGKIEMGAAPSELPETSTESSVAKEMRYVYQNLSRRNLLEHFHDALHRRDEAMTMFNLGLLTLEDRAKVETLFWQICKVIHKHVKELKYVPEELEALNKHLADQYLCNFSVFQSMPDHWAIQQLFPIVPLHRHDEEPTREATLVDITCDSDGKVCKFIDLRDISDTLKVHELREGSPYLLGFFLLGAYQDIMGDFHNLFGQVNEVHVFLDETEPCGYYIEEVLRGHDIGELLSLNQYNSAYLKKGVKNQIDRNVRESTIKPREGVDLQRFYESVLAGYTYMEEHPKQALNLNKPLPAIEQNDFGVASI